MALKWKGRVRETTTTTGTGALTLGGAVTAYGTFASLLSTGDTCYGTVAHRTTTEWEDCLFTMQSDGTLARTTVIDGSSGVGTAVSLSSGTKDVFLGLPPAIVEALLGASLVTLGTASYITSERVLTAGSGISLTDAGAGSTLTIAATGSYTDEQAQDAVGGALTDSSTIDFTYSDAGNTITAAVIVAGLSGIDHGSQLTGLSDDDHTQYALLAGRSGGQTLIGGTASGDDLTLKSTSHATKGTVFLGTASAYDEVNDRLGIGTTAPSTAGHIILSDSATNTVSTVLTIGHNTSGTVAGEFGSQILFQGESSSTNNQDVGNLIFSWFDQTHASRKGQVFVNVFSTTTAQQVLWAYPHSDGLARVIMTGRLGIGTTNAPSAKLHIAATNATAWFIGNTSNGNYAQMLFGEGSADGTYAEFVRYSNATSGAQGSGLFIVGNYNKATLFTQSTTFRRDLYITSGGLVGMGTTIGTDPVTRLEVAENDAVTNAVTTVATLSHNTSGTAAAGFGGGLAFRLESSTTVDQTAGLISCSWTDATHATRTGKLTLSAHYTGTEQAIATLTAHASGVRFSITSIAGYLTCPGGLTAGAFNEVFGQGSGAALASGATNNTLLGYGAGAAVSTSDDHTILGYLTAPTLTTGGGCTIVGSGADVYNATDNGAVVIGHGARSGDGCVAVGRSAVAQGTNGVAVGKSASAGGSLGVAIGTLCLAANTDGIVIGDTQQTGASYQTLIGRQLSGDGAGSFCFGHKSQDTFLAWMRDTSGVGSGTAKAQIRVVPGWDVSTEGSQMGKVSHQVLDVTTARTFLQAIATSGAVKVGFFGATPVVKPATTGTVTGYTGGGGTALTHSDTFTGNTGATAYTIGDIVKALKDLGLLTA